MWPKQQGKSDGEQENGWYKESERERARERKLIWKWEEANENEYNRNHVIRMYALFSAIIEPK